MAEENINEKIATLKKEIQLLNTTLKDLNTKKETKYKEKEDLDERLNSLIKEAKELKEQKQKLNESIKEVKKLRDLKNNLVAALRNNFLRLKQEKKDQLRKEKVPSVNEIREKIKQIEFIIQTQPVSFEREKKYMKEIRELRAKEKEVEEINKSFDDINQMQSKLNAEKEEADRLHKKIQDLAAENTNLFDELTKKSREIISIKDQRNTAMAFLRTVKLQMNSINKKLGMILKSWSVTSSKSVKDITRKSLDLLQQKTAEVKEKFKDKKRLTTEDILLLQREAMSGRK